MFLVPVCEMFLQLVLIYLQIIHGAMFLPVEVTHLGLRLVECFWDG